VLGTAQRRLARAEDWRFETRRRIDAARPCGCHLDLEMDRAWSSLKSTFRRLIVEQQDKVSPTLVDGKTSPNFCFFVLLLSAGISLLYDYRLKTWRFKGCVGRTPENTRLLRIGGQSKTSRVA